MTARELRLSGMTWLAYEKNCRCVVAERGVRKVLGDPDIIGVTSARHVTEIEIKVTMSDFRRNAKKRQIIARDYYIKSWPKFYWFLVPPDLVDQVLEEMPVWAGLLTVDHIRTVKVVSPAPENRFSRRLSLKELAKLVRCMTNHVIAAERQAIEFRNTFWLHEPRSVEDYCI